MGINIFMIFVAFIQISKNKAKSPRVYPNYYYFFFNVYKEERKELEF